MQLQMMDVRRSEVDTGVLRAIEEQIKKIQEDQQAGDARVQRIAEKHDAKIRFFLWPRPPTDCTSSCHTVLHLFTRLRNCTENVEDSVDLEQFKREWTGGEGNQIMSRAVTTGINRNIVFIIALMGYSGGGGSLSPLSGPRVSYLLLSTCFH